MDYNPLWISHANKVKYWKSWNLSAQASVCPWFKAASIVLLIVMGFFFLSNVFFQKAMTDTKLKKQPIVIIRTCELS